MFRLDGSGQFAVLGFHAFGELPSLDVQFIQLLISFFQDLFAAGLFGLQAGVELFEFMLDLGQFLADSLNIAEPQFLRFPLLAQTCQLSAPFFHFLLDILELRAGGLFMFPGELSRGQFQLRQSPLYLVDFGRNTFPFHG